MRPSQRTHLQTSTSLYVRNWLSMAPLLLCCLVAGCSWSVTSLRASSPKNGERLESASVLGAVPGEAAVICSRLPIKIVGIDQHSTYKAYRSTNKAAFIVEPGLHTIEYRFGDDMRYMSEILVAEVTVAPGTVTEVRLERSLPIQAAAQHPLAYNTVWVAQFISDSTACGK